LVFLSLPEADQFRKSFYFNRIPDNAVNRKNNHIEYRYNHFVMSMKFTVINFIQRWLVFIFLILAFTACSQKISPTVSIPSSITPAKISPSISPDSTALPTVISPSATLLPLAAKINQDELTLAEYQAELDRYKAAVGRDLTPEDKKNVLDDLIGQYLLAQAAAEKGFIVDEAMLNERLAQLTTATGGQQALADWLTSLGYSDTDFRKALSHSIAAAWMRDQIIAAVPLTADQVHARQILLFSSEKANEAFSQLQSGKDFATLAKTYDPMTGGDLGWFPRGYLKDSGLEDIAFSLKPKEYSKVIETRTGFHILQVIERDPQRALEPQARLALQAQAIQNWLNLRRNQSQIQILLPVQ
jgi:peptidyl-prolyl cis-trans isomerase C